MLVCVSDVHVSVGFLTVKKVFLTEAVENMSKTSPNIIKNLLKTKAFDIVLDMFLTTKTMIEHVYIRLAEGSLYLYKTREIDGELC